VKVLLIVMSSIVMLIGAAMIAVGALAVAAVDSDGFINSGDTELTSEVSAFVSGVAELEAVSLDGPFGIGDPNDLKIRISAAAGDQDVFIGIARDEDVDAWLEGATYERLEDIDFDPFEVSVQRVEGDRLPGSPIEQTFWVASVTGPGRQTLTWEVETGTFRFVLMNADGSQPLALEGAMGVSVPLIKEAGWVSIGVGIFLVLAAILVIILAATRMGRQGPPPPAPPGEVPPTTQADLAAAPRPDLATIPPADLPPPPAGLSGMPPPDVTPPQPPPAPPSSTGLP
jgi:hypothetical protein